MPRITFLSTLMMLAFCVITLKAQVTNDTVAYYNFDNVKDFTVPSATGKFDGLLKGTATTVPAGSPGKALEITNCKTYMVIENFGFGEMPEGAIELWVKLLKPSPCGRKDNGEWTVIANFGDNFGAKADASSLGTGEWAVNRTSVLFGVFDAGWHWADSGVLIEDLYGEWHHLAGAWGIGSLG